jgi:demethylmenaquinone methyltransferase/2-methoxy-6-polyprenyl-1,4-benzoquinol methylase
MRVLEAAPQRYDRGMRLLFGSTLDAVHREIADRAATPGSAVLDIGCGTGGVALACAARGAHVVGIDRDPGMLEVARAKADAQDLAGRTEWVELAAMELEDRFDGADFDAVVGCLVLSELPPAEQTYVLQVARRCLRPGGAIVMADEVAATTPPRRARAWARRVPGAAVSFLVTRRTSRPVADLAGLLAGAGFLDVDRVEFRDLEIVEGTAPEAQP